MRSYNTQVTWLPRIKPYTPGAVATASWDADRGEVTSQTDGTFGVGWQIVDAAGVLRQGYYAPIVIQVGIDDNPTVTRLEDYGVVGYQGPLVIYRPPIVLDKLDVIVRPDGSRCVVGDRLTPAQVFGQTELYTSELEQRTAPSDPIYAIPLV